MKSSKFTSERGTSNAYRIVDGESLTNVASYKTKEIVIKLKLVSGKSLVKT
jgi:hypothetical protein